MYNFYCIIFLISVLSDTNTFTSVYTLRIVTHEGAQRLLILLSFCYYLNLVMYLNNVHLTPFIHERLTSTQFNLHFSSQIFPGQQGRQNEPGVKYYLLRHNRAGKLKLFKYNFHQVGIESTVSRCPTAPRQPQFKEYTCLICSLYTRYRKNSILTLLYIAGSSNLIFQYSEVISSLKYKQIIIAYSNNILYDLFTFYMELLIVAHVVTITLSQLVIIALECSASVSDIEPIV